MTATLTQRLQPLRPKAVERSFLSFLDSKVSASSLVQNVQTSSSIWIKKSSGGYGSKSPADSKSLQRRRCAAAGFFSGLAGLFAADGLFSAAVGSFCAAAGFGCFAPFFALVAFCSVAAFFGTCLMLLQQAVPIYIYIYLFTDTVTLEHSGCHRYIGRQPIYVATVKHSGCDRYNGIQPQCSKNHLLKVFFSQICGRIYFNLLNILQVHCGLRVLLDFAILAILSLCRFPRCTHLVPILILLASSVHHTHKDLLHEDLLHSAPIFSSQDIVAQQNSKQALIADVFLDILLKSFPHRAEEEVFPSLLQWCPELQPQLVRCCIVQRNTPISTNLAVRCQQNFCHWNLIHVSHAHIDVVWSMLIGMVAGPYATTSREASPRHIALVGPPCQPTGQNNGFAAEAYLGRLRVAQALEALSLGVKIL